MPIVGLICPDGETIKTEDCLKHCRMSERCITRPTAEQMTRNRPWTGTPSTTECLNGTREAYLKRMKDYYVDPQGRAFALLGTRHHTRMEGAADRVRNVLAEERFNDDTDEVSGIVDLLEPIDGEANLYDLTDYKTWGSYSVMKALGNYEVVVHLGEHYKSGKKKGQEKTRKEIRQDPSKSDFGDPLMQLNRYRIFLERVGFPIRKMKIQATVRDGGTYMAINRKIDRNLYVFEIPRLEDRLVIDYFSRKSADLVEAITKEEMPAPCQPDECWEGRKCGKFCDVWSFCPQGREARERAEAKERR